MRCGPTIRKFRHQAGMTQHQLARAIDRCTASISLYEQGKRDLPLSVITRIAKALNVAPSLLLDDENHDDEE